MFIRTLTLFVLLASTTRTESRGDECTPVAPSGKWDVIGELLEHAYTDGYRVEAVVRYPDTEPPACGWPLVVCVHGSGGSKAVVASLATDIASRGYATMAYDVRGQGPSMGLNDLELFGSTIDGIRELIDLFEIMEATEAAFPDRVDFDRIAVTGYSQGGGHSWRAAANSARLPPTNQWREAAFPIITCAIPRDSSGPGFGTGPMASLSMSNRLIEKMFGPSSGRWYVPAHKAQFQEWILAENFPAIADARTNPELDPSVLLPASQVPVLAHVSYDDYRISASSALASWQLMTGSPQKRLQGGTGGHSSPNNTHDSELWNALMRLWLDHFMKDVDNDVTRLAPVYLSITPDDVDAYRDPETIRDFRMMDDVPSAITETRSLYLDHDGHLAATAPVEAGSATLVHDPPADADMATYAATLPSAAELVAAFGLNTITWETAPLGQDRHLQGQAALELYVDTVDPRFHVHAVLFDVAPNGDARYVVDGRVAVRDNLPPGANVLEIRFYPQSYVFRAGHTLRLQLENLVIHRPPSGNGAEIRSPPVFEASSVEIDFGEATPSRFDLPIASPPVEGDVDRDGDVDFVDLLLVLAAWGPCELPDGCLEDLNGDGEIAFDDLLIVLANF